MLERIQNDRENPLRPFTQEEIDVFIARELTPSEILENEFFDAMEADNFDKIEEILNKRVPNPEEHLRVTKYCPSIRCLSECIWNLQKHQYINNPITYIKYKDLVMRLLSAPYFIKPDDTCLCYAIMNQEHELIHMIVTRYKRYLNCDENTLQYAISACNVKMVRFLLFKYRVPIDEELLDFIEVDKQTEDDFPIEERGKRNIMIRRMIKKALREDHF